MFFDANISMVYNLFNEMSYNTLDFFKKGDNEVLANIIFSL